MTDQLPPRASDATGPAPAADPGTVAPDDAPILRVRGPRASSVFVARHPVEQADEYLAWQREAADLAGTFPGYQATEVYPPPEGEDEWVAIVHFDDHDTLQAWLDSPERAAWVARLTHPASDFRIHTMPTGFGTWVAGQTASGVRIPHWKSFLLVLLGLYPVVMLLTLVVSPRTEPLGLALAMLAGNVLSVATLEWVVMPLLNRLLGPWLEASGSAGRRATIVGAAGIVAAIAGMAIGFRLIAG